jgi:hypothetical protein
MTLRVLVGEDKIEGIFFLRSSTHPQDSQVDILTITVKLSINRILFQ